MSAYGNGDVEDFGYKCPGFEPERGGNRFGLCDLGSSISSYCMARIVIRKATDRLRSTIFSVKDGQKKGSSKQLVVIRCPMQRVECVVRMQLFLSAPYTETVEDWRNQNFVYYFKFSGKFQFIEFYGECFSRLLLSAIWRRMLNYLLVPIIGM